MRAAVQVVCKVGMVPCDWFCQVAGGEGQLPVETGFGSLRSGIGFFPWCRAVHRGLVKKYG